MEAAHQLSSRPDCNSTEDVPSFTMRNCSFSNAIRPGSMRCRNSMIPWQIFTGCAKFQWMVDEIWGMDARCFVLEPKKKKRSDESVTWCWECAQKTYHHSVVRQEKGSRRTCAIPTKHLHQVKNADHKCMLETLWFPQNWQQYWNVSNCCSHKTLLHERTRSTFGIDWLMSNCWCEVSLTKTIETCQINMNCP